MRPKYLLKSAAVAAIATVLCSSGHADLIRPGFGSSPVEPRFHSFKGREHKISFQAVYKTERSVILSLQNEADLDARNAGFKRVASAVWPYLMGPATNRNLGGPKKIEKVSVAWEKVSFQGSKALVPYTYEATWIIDLSLSQGGTFLLPVPYNENDLLTSRWKNCTDSAPDHQTQSFYWYFWDPARYGCDHRVGSEYQEVKVIVGEMTENQSETYPEYERMVHEVNGVKTLTATFAFGYVADSNVSNPQTDEDMGAGQYRSFLSYVETQLPDFTKAAIKKSDYDESGSTVIGYIYKGQRSGMDYELKVVINAGVDQMKLFAKSFAHDHDGFFAWFGHSRVGSGFDADQFRNIVKYNPETYSITDQYQLIYWAGCNSYTYYTLAFFKFKSELNPDLDPNGTKNLDIISNGMPSFFDLNMPNAQISLDALLKWPNEKVSYQSWIEEIENRSWRQAILTNVLGDEDNAQ